MSRAPSSSPRTRTSSKTAASRPKARRLRTALLHPARVATLTLVDTHEGFEAFTPEQRRAFVDSRRAPLLAGKTPADIAEPVARSLMGPHATEAHFRQLVDSIAALHKDS